MLSPWLLSAAPAPTAAPLAQDHTARTTHQGPGPPGRQPPAVTSLSERLWENEDGATRLPASPCRTLQGCPPAPGGRPKGPRRAPGPQAQADRPVGQPCVPTGGPAAPPAGEPEEPAAAPGRGRGRGPNQPAPAPPPGEAEGSGQVGIRLTLALAPTWAQSLLPPRRPSPGGRCQR